jgi:hypothetical protein
MRIKIVGLKMTKIQGLDGRIDKRKIAILIIDFILNYYYFEPWKYGVIKFASPKWV